MPTNTPILEARNLVKRFGDVMALKGVTFSLHGGEVHAICGENGAGKSTLIKLLSGIHPAGTYDGDILVDGNITQLAGTRDATAAGIAVIYQELALVPEMTVAENIFLGTEPRKFGGIIIDHAKMQRDAQVLLDQFGLGIQATSRILDLGIGHRQLVEIAKALSKKSRVLILDEPTAALTEREVDVLLNILRDLRSRSMGLIYISHKLDEVLDISDRITVLRDGASVAAMQTKETTKDEIIRNMVGRKIEDLFPRRASHPGEVLLSARNLTVVAEGRPGNVLTDVSFEVRAGEVLGIGGLMGAGRTELLMHLFGAYGKRVAGTVTLAGGELSATHKPSESVRRGLVLVSEDRKRYGLILDRDISFNFSLSSLFSFAKSGFINESEERRRNGELFKSLRVKANNMEAIVGRLSGGNQQKVVIGKALLTEPKVVFLDEPTRGIDVGAKLEVYNLVNEFTAQGKAVVLVSSELPELMGMSDRIMMLSGGRATGTFTRVEATQEKLLAAAMASAMTPLPSTQTETSGTLLS